MSGAAKILVLTAILGFLAAVLVVALQTGGEAPPEGPKPVLAPASADNPVAPQASRTRHISDFEGGLFPRNWSESN